MKGEAPEPHDPAAPAQPVAAEEYSRDYFLSRCGGAEFFELYGPKVLKPTLAYCLSRAALAPGLRALDIGCGRGELLYQIKLTGAVGVGTDFAGPAVAIARQVSGCEVIETDAKVLPFPDRSFDRVFLLGIMDHLHRWELEDCFREIRRVLKPGGFVLIHTCTNRLYYKVWTYRLRLLARALRACGLSLRVPSPPRSSDDQALRAFFGSIGWRAEVEPRPNWKMVIDELYGRDLPAGVPIKPAARWRVRVYKALLWWPPLNWVLARDFFCLARPAGVSGPAARR